jgi:hypothetical protein
MITLYFFLFLGVKNECISIRRRTIFIKRWENMEYVYMYNLRKNWVILLRIGGARVIGGNFLNFPMILPIDGIAKTTH